MLVRMHMSVHACEYVHIIVSACICAYMHVCACMCVLVCVYLYECVWMSLCTVWCMYMDTLHHTYILYYMYLVAQLDSIIYHLLMLYYWPAPVLAQGYSGLAVSMKPV